MFGIRSICVLAVVGMIALAASSSGRGQDKPGLQRPFDAGMKQAEKLISESAYARALQIYDAIDLSDLSHDERRWTLFRRGDCRWRAAAGTAQPDDSAFELARRQLTEVIDAVEDVKDRDLAWASAQESLGDFWWTRRQSNNWHQGWNHYNAALDWWAGSSDVDLARDAYLSIVWKASDRPEYYNEWWWPNAIPMSVLENAAQIAEREEDIARAYYLMARHQSHYAGSWRQRLSVSDYFSRAIEFGPDNPWHDDALFFFAQWVSNQGIITRDANGQWSVEPDFVRAVKLYNELEATYRKGESQFRDNAVNAAKEITQRHLTAAVPGAFLPNSEIKFDLQYRNVSEITCSIYRIDLTRDLDFTKEMDNNGWLSQVRLSGDNRVRNWTIEIADAGLHRWGNRSESLDEPLPIGAYLLVTTSGENTQRELLLVTDIALIAKRYDDQHLVYVGDAISGHPVSEADVNIWHYRKVNRAWVHRRDDGRTDADGLYSMTIKNGGAQLWNSIVIAKIGDRQTIMSGPRIWTPGRFEGWRLFTAADRPAYRPGETVKWKVTARQMRRGTYIMPGVSEILYEINGPQGKISEGTMALNTFGSAWAELELVTEHALGEYHVTFKSEDGKHSLGDSPLFRIEEYKLPEFEVTVKTPTQDDGTPKTFLLGDSVQATINAAYYFGGPVANANVELVVRQRPYWHTWYRPRQYGWLYDRPQNHNWWNQGSVIKQETTRTDANGQVVINFETPAEQGNALEYIIEARVTDSSRREVTGTSSVRVTAQRHYVYPHVTKSVVMPGTQVDVEFVTRDANNAPVSIDGSVHVTRQIWREIWVGPTGREVFGKELDSMRQKLMFPPPGEPGWYCRHRGFEEESVLTQAVTTNAEGKAKFAFTPEKTGYYKIAWSSIVTDEPPVTSATYAWVARPGDVDISYRSDGVQIVVESDTFRAGDEATVMITTPVSDRYVLFTLEGRSLYSHQLVHVANTAKLIRVPIDSRSIPNAIFTASMIDRTTIQTASAPIVVPPVDQFLNVDVASASEAYQPRDEGTFTVSVTDSEGRPVSAELSFGVVDESVFAIQSPYAGDPREFFFGDRQPHAVATEFSTSQRGFVRLVRGPNGEIMPEAELQERLRADRDGDMNAFDDRSAGRTDDQQIMLGQTVQADSALASGSGGAMFSSPSANPPASVMKSMDKDGMRGKAVGGGGGGQDWQPTENIVVRTDFRSTIFWQPDLTTDADGRASVDVSFADSLTRWRGTAFAATNGNQFGTGEISVRTRQPLIARLQAPRFFTVGDELILSGVFNNNTETDIVIRPTLEADGMLLTGMIVDGERRELALYEITVPPNGDARIDWLAIVDKAGEVELKLVAQGLDYSDAMVKTYPAYAHGIQKFLASSGKVRGDRITVALDIPAARQVDTTSMRIRVAGSMAVTMLDALPYLVDYPYGCTEQTMSRFVPTIVTAKTLRDLGLEPGDALSRVFGGVDPQFVDKTHTHVERHQRAYAKLDDVTQKSLTRLYDFQHTDGGWGWWKDGDSDHYMTAYVLWGLSLAQEAELDVKPDVLENAARYLQRELVEAENRLDLQTWMMHALSVWHNVSGDTELSGPEGKAFANLFVRKDALNAYTRSLLALTAHRLGRTDDARVLVRTLENGVIRDDRPDQSVVIGNAGGNAAAVMAQAHWGNDGLYWRWSEGAVETTSWALQALLAIEPDHDLVEPVTNWLIRNRRGAHWSNTRDTAMTVLAMNAYLRTSGELKGDLGFEVMLNGQSIGTRTIAAKDRLSAPMWFDVDPAYIQNGVNEITIIKRTGDAPIYFSAQAEFFSLEEPIPAAGNEIFVKRDYYKLTPRDTLLKGVVYDRVPLKDGGYVNSGERIEVILTVEAKNDYEYLVFEDLKPAGFEAVRIRSGEAAWFRQLSQQAITLAADMNNPERLPAVRAARDYTGRSRWVHQELRDRKTAIFIDKMPEGVWEIRYDYRAEVPGAFHGLPLMAHAMYVPEIRANSDEIRVTVNERHE
jgi:hypothetical protein